MLPSLNTTRLQARGAHPRVQVNSSALWIQVWSRTPRQQASLHIIGLDDFHPRQPPRRHKRQHLVFTSDRAVSPIFRRRCWESGKGRALLTFSTDNTTPTDVEAGGTSAPGIRTQDHADEILESEQRDAEESVASFGSCSDRFNSKIARLGFHLCPGLEDIRYQILAVNLRASEGESIVGGLSPPGA